MGDARDKKGKLIMIRKILLLFVMGLILATIVFGMGFGAGNGVITGAALVWLLRQSPSKDVERLAIAH
jgi:hypothetical protein